MREIGQEKHSSIYWFPRISAISFVILMFLMIYQDFFQTLMKFPVFYNYFIGTIVLSITMICWRKRGIFIGLIFILIGGLYFYFMLHRLLLAMITPTSLWLVLTGFLFLIEEFAERRQKRKQERPKEVFTEMLIEETVLDNPTRS